MSKVRNRVRPGIQVSRNQVITSPVLRHWLTGVLERMMAVVCSRITLLIRPISDLAGLIRRQGRSVSKLGLCLVVLQQYESLGGFALLHAAREI